VSSTPRPTRRRPLLTGGIVTVVLLAVGGRAASAHIDPDPAAVAAGSSATISFTVEHGCDGSATVKIEMKIPEGFDAVAAPPKDGWTVTVNTGSVVWEGGPLDASTPDTFALSFTAPVAAGDYALPVIQSCEAGELAWVQEEVEGQPEPELPAPVLLVTSGEPTDEELGGHDAGGAGGTEPTLIATDDGAPGDHTSNTGAVVGGVVAAIVVLGGGGYVLSRKRKGSKPPA